MNEEKKIVETHEDYTVEELINQLMEDDSWEADPVWRRRAIDMLVMSVFPVC